MSDEDCLSFIQDPYTRLCAEVIMRAINDVKIDPLRACTCKDRSFHTSHIREDAYSKITAIDFIKSEHLDFWIDICGLNMDSRLIRERLANELEKRDSIPRLISENINYPQKSSRVKVYKENQ